MRLLGVELNRILSRRLTLLSVLAAAAVLGLLMLAFNASLNLTDSVETRAAYDQAVEEWESSQGRIEGCEASGAPAQACTYPRPTEADYGLALPKFQDSFDPALQTVPYLGGIAAFLIAASSIGAEFTSGAIGNWLSFVPRRIPVYASKLGAVVITSAVIGAVLSALTLAGGAALMLAHGGAITGLPSLLATAGRSTAAVVVLAVVGFVIALVGRHTVVALGALMAYGVVALIRMAVFDNAAWAQRLTPWTPEENLQALIGNGTSYSVSALTTGTEVSRVLSVGHGTAYLAVLLAVLVVAGAVIFRRRDVS